MTAAIGVWVECSILPGIFSGYCSLRILMARSSIKPTFCWCVDVTALQHLWFAVLLSHTHYSPDFIPSDYVFLQQKILRGQF